MVSIVIYWGANFGNQSLFCWDVLDKFKLLGWLDIVRPKWWWRLLFILFCHNNCMSFPIYFRSIVIIRPKSLVKFRSFRHTSFICLWSSVDPGHWFRRWWLSFLYLFLATNRFWFLSSYHGTSYTWSLKLFFYLNRCLIRYDYHRSIIIHYIVYANLYCWICWIIDFLSGQVFGIVARYIGILRRLLKFVAGCIWFIKIIIPFRFYFWITLIYAKILIRNGLKSCLHTCFSLFSILWADCDFALFTISGFNLA